MSSVTLSSFDPTASLDARSLAHAPVLGLVLLWSRDEPGRVGEVSLVHSMEPGALATLGRGQPPPGHSLPRMEWARQQPGRCVPTGPLVSPRISRTHLQVEVVGPRALRLVCTGRVPLVHEGREVESVVLAPGDMVALQKLALFMCVARPPLLPSTDPPVLLHPFGEADAHGIVGEGPAAWQLRAHIAFAAVGSVHALIRGPSGTGKELVAQAIHRLSARAARPLVSRNAATFPETLLDAELFGNAPGFPNPGMRERPGLVGEAEGSSLFLDEFAELPQALQTHLLRVLDAGEYTRLGESKPRRSDFRLIAATNRPEQALRHDVLARLSLRLELCGLEQRREDIPLLARHLLRRIGRQNNLVARRYFPGGDLFGIPQMRMELVERLVRHAYSTHVRELEALLWRAISHSPGDTLGLWPEEEREAPPAAPADPTPVDESVSQGDEPPSPAVDPLGIPPEVIQACLDKHGGRQEPVWRELGLTSRHVLTRLVRRYNLSVRGRSGRD